MSNFYRGMTKSIIAGFGSLFSNIHIIRRKDNTVSGPVVQDIKIPISYAPAMKWMQAIKGDPDRRKQVWAQLPRISYEIMGFSYDATRKQTRSANYSCIKKNGKSYVMSTPSPWNLDITMYIVSNNQEDCFQILEQILPLFNPDYTLTLHTVKEMNVVSNIPISLSGVSVQDDYDGEYTSHRLVIYTLNFVVKALYYGFADTSGLVTRADVNVGNFDSFAEYDTKTKTIKEGIISLDSEINLESTEDFLSDKSPEVKITEE